MRPGDQGTPLLLSGSSGAHGQHDQVWPQGGTALDSQVDPIWNTYPRTQTSQTTGSWGSWGMADVLSWEDLFSLLRSLAFIRFSFLSKYSSDHFKIRHGQLLSMTLRLPRVGHSSWLSHIQVLLISLVPGSQDLVVPQLGLWTPVWLPTLEATL